MSRRLKSNEELYNTKSVIWQKHAPFQKKQDLLTIAPLKDGCVVLSSSHVLSGFVFLAKEWKSAFIAYEIESEKLLLYNTAIKQSAGTQICRNL